MTQAIGINWTAVEDAISAWVRGATGLSDGSVIWADQGKARPAAPWVSLNRISTQRRGRDWTTYELDGTSNGHDGHELVATVRGLRTMHLSVQAFAVDATGSGSALGLLESVVASAEMPSVRAVLKAANIAVASLGTVQSRGQAVNVTVFEPRATLDVQINLTSAVTEAATVIDTVNVADPGLGVSVSVT